MAYPKKWKHGGKTITLTVPRRVKEPAMALAVLLDQGDRELLDFLESRFIPIPEPPIEIQE